MKELNFEGLARLLLTQSRDLVYKWLPGGKIVGAEYCCGSLVGGPGDSLRVNINKGKWADFATNDRGGDLVSLYAAIKGKTQGEAYKELSEEVSFSNGNNTAVAVLDKPPDEIVMPPAGVDLENPFELFAHREYGTPVDYWVYRTVDGDPIFCVARYEVKGKKQILPWTWHRRGYWNCKGWPPPRPLYGLEYLKDFDGSKRILIVEGEKAAVAARKICGDNYIVLTWPNGAQGINKVDWSILKEMIILLWPDADDPGKQAMLKIASILVKQGCTVRIIDPKDKVDGWDAADALDEGMNFAALKAWATPLVSKYEIAKTKTDIVTAEAVVENEKMVVAAQANVQVLTEDTQVVTISLRKLWDDLGLILAKSSETPHCNYDNALRVLKKHDPLKGIVWYDEFHDKIFTQKEGYRREWADNDDTMLAVYFQGALGFVKISKECISSAVTAYAKENTRNEPRDWLDSLVHDGQDRISHFFETYYGSPYDAYHMKAAMNFWVGMVARIYRPGCQNDNMIVLEGPQGIGKSRSLEVIGGDWFCVASENVQSKDFYQVLKGKMIVEIAELDSFGKADVTRIKQVISASKDTYRASYDRRSMDHPRHSVFVGTTNEKSYLRDVTGARRFWPVACGKRVDLEGLKRDRDQLFAQAVLQFKQGDEWYIMPDDETVFIQESRRQHDDWEEVVSEYILFKDKVTSLEVAREALKISVDKLDKQTQRRIGGILRVLKWEEYVWKENGMCKRGWQKLGK